MTDVEALVETYLTIRRQRETLKVEYEAQDSALKTDIEKLEAALLDICNQTNTNGFKTTYGTVTRQVKDRERKDDGLPPGVNSLREYDIVVRKASSTSATTV